MTTLYEEIFERFTSKIEDYDLLGMFQDEIEEILADFLRSSIPKFTYCAKDLANRDDVLKQFNIELIDMEKEILSLLMVVEYLSPKIIRSELLEQRLGSKDFQLWSPANQLKETRELRESAKNEAKNLMVEYYYLYGWDN